DAPRSPRPVTGALELATPTGVAPAASTAQSAARIARTLGTSCGVSAHLQLATGIRGRLRSPGSSTDPLSHAETLIAVRARHGRHHLPVHPGSSPGIQ